MIFQVFVLCFALIVGAVPVCAESLKPGERPISDAGSVFAIYTEHHGLSSDKPATNRLIFAAWADGRVVFSADPVHGGSPYRTGRIDPQRIEAALAIVKRDGLFDDELFARPQFGPDSQTTVIEVKTGASQVKLQSWHELYEADGKLKLVATEKGLGSLGDKTRLAALGEASHEYLLYRIAWTELRLAAAELVPIESQPTNGRLAFREGKTVWVEQ